MSDLRNFHVSNESDIGRTPIELSPIEPSLSELSVYESSPGLEENAPLSAFHTVEDDEGSNTGRIAGGLVVALMVGAAAIYGYEDVARILLEKGADPELRDEDGLTAAAWAAKNKRDEMAQLLKDAAKKQK